MKEAAIWESVDALKPWKDNPRKNKGAINHVAESIRRFGFASPIIARSEDKVIIAGHTRFEAAKKLGLDSVPVRYLDLDPADSRLLALADNKIGEIAEWNEEKLEKVMQELLDEGLSLDGLGWSDEELEKIVEELKQEEIEEDEVPEADEEGEPDSKLGEVYELGEHRLICGDSTLPETWEKLMQGEKADMVFTDPPYNINFQGTMSNTSKNGLLIPHIGANAKYEDIKNDKKNKEFFYNFICSVLDRIKENTTGGWYICFSQSTLNELLNPLIQKKMKWKSIIIWNKNQSPMGGGHFRRKYEPIVYGYFDNIFYGKEYSEDDVWNIDRTRKNDLHPTMKPVPLVCKAIQYSSQKDGIVIDAFGGSGSTLIAAAQTKRRARLVELDPKYCDVIRRRWTQYAKDHDLEVGTGGLE